MTVKSKLMREMKAKDFWSRRVRVGRWRSFWLFVFGQVLDMILSIDSVER